MKTFISAFMLAFDVGLYNKKTHQTVEDVIVLTKDQLRAAQIVGESSKELITRLYSRKGYKVEWIGKPVRREAVLDLEKLFLEAVKD